jgi:hypothetical protein
MLDPTMPPPMITTSADSLILFDTEPFARSAGANLSPAPSAEFVRRPGRLLTADYATLYPPSLNYKG